jgi:integrase
VVRQVPTDPRAVVWSPKRPPDQLKQAHLREYQAYLLRDRQLEPRTVKLHVSALRLFFVRTLKRRYLLDDIPYPKVPRRLPTLEEVTRLIDAARTLTDRTSWFAPSPLSARPHPECSAAMSTGCDSQPRPLEGLSQTWHNAVMPISEHARRRSRCIR